ncbi:radical SAM domain-containing protein [Clostridium aceticum]|uniref:Radical SAM domain-containing protein n=1 Tax=Clostridium aceticum TaxID=84022 RepID=A0A0D8I5A8_9CLOT|nr:radical SAM protein [Clostridium aceticum]AKL94334.1 radical SAM domain-containing protein [Clostridium aceticum]KJF25418.1 radical SAM protein [Clostridium aceticum]
MEFKPITAVWEITMGCNMRCKHCGSSCENPLEGELNTEEALKLCDEMGELGFRWITLSGGEPTTRKDWHLIAKRLHDNGIIPNIITNGWTMDEEIAEKAAKAGVNTVAFSVDGLKKTHDYIRKPESFDRIMKSIDIVRKKDLNCSIITTINKININELWEMKKIFDSKKINGWQFQIGLPMGNMATNNNLIAQPYHVDAIIDFAYEVSRDNGIEIQLADCVGYFNKKEIQVRTKYHNLGSYQWRGCGAGKYSMGILHNGDILGCTSIRDKSFVEGNIRRTPLKQIWNDPDKFSWNREMKKDKLTGFCGKCGFGDRCLGGCGNTRLIFGESIYSENTYCSYNNAIKKADMQLSKIENIQEAVNKAKKFIDNKSFQLAQLILEKMIHTNQENEEILNLYGYVSFMLHNYSEAKNINEKLLKQRPNDPYPHKGYGLSVARLGAVEEGIKYLKKAIKLSDKSFMDPYYDLAVIYMENNRRKEAISILEKGMNKSAEFAKNCKSFYEGLINDTQISG